MRQSSRVLLVALNLLLLTALAAPAGVLGGAQAMPLAEVVPARGSVGATIAIQGHGWPAGRPVTVAFGRRSQGLDHWLLDWVRGTVAYDGSVVLTAAVPRHYTSLGGRTVQVTPGDYDLVVATVPGTDGGTTSVSLAFAVVADLAPTPPTINWRFHDYYYAHDGGRLLGQPLDGVRFESGRRVQYFEKGRLEEHAEAEGAWRYQFGRLGADLIASDASLPVGGETSSLTYAGLRDLAAAERRQPPPPDWRAVTAAAGEPVFIPFDSGLQPAPGHYVPAPFWSYMNESRLFPAGWLRAIGLPLTEALAATVTKTVDGRTVERTITVQLFERTVLTDDPANPAGFRIERANIGADVLAAIPMDAVPGDVVLHPAFAWVGPARPDELLPEAVGRPAWEWQSRPNATVKMEDEIPALRRELEREGWTVETSPPGGFAMGSLIGVKGQRRQEISWWLGVRPVLPPEQPDLGVRMRVVVGRRV